MYAHQVAAAVGYTMFLMEPDEDRLESFPVWDCEEEEIAAPIEKIETKKSSSGKNLRRKSEIHQDFDSRKKKK